MGRPKRQVAECSSANAGATGKSARTCRQKSPSTAAVAEEPDGNGIGAEIDVELIVKGIPAGTELHEVELHFNRKCNGGRGDVKLISWDPVESASDTLTARVTFGAKSTVESVMAFPYPQQMKGAKLELFPAGLKNFVAPIDPTPLASKTKLAKWRSDPPKLQLPPKLSYEADVGYLDVEIVVANDPPENIFRTEGGDPDHRADLIVVPPGGDSNHQWRSKNRSKAELIRHIAIISHKLTNLSGHVAKAYLLLLSKGKNPQKKLNADEVKELERLKEILKVDVSDTLNSSVSQLHQTVKRLENKLAKSERIRVELRNQTVAKQKKLELSEAEVLLLNQNLTESQSDSKLAQENVEICQAEIVQLNLTISQLLESGTEDQTESERIRAELREKLATQQECIRQLNESLSGRSELQSELNAAEDKLKLSDAQVDSLQEEVARGLQTVVKSQRNQKSLRSRNSHVLEKVNRLKRLLNETRSGLQSKLRSSEEKSEKSVTLITSLQAEIVGLKGDLQDKANQLVQQLKESNRLKVEREEIQEKLQSAEDKVVKSQEALRLSQETCESLQSENDLLKAEVQRLLNDKQENFESSQKKIASLQDKLLIQREMNVSPTESNIDDPQEELIEFVQNYTCSQCHFSAGSYVRLKSHKRTHEEKVECPICLRIVKKSRLPKHLVLARQEGTVPYKAHNRRSFAKRRICEFCPKWSGPKFTYHSLQSHLYKKHRNEINKIKASKGGTPIEP